MFRSISAAMLLFALAGLPAPALAQEARTAPVEAAAHKPKVQLAILLDTSNSMDGLIDQARAQIWNIVNELATSKSKGQRPELTVALYEYGKQSIPAAEGYLRQVLPLTGDLDEVSKQLFALTTNGGDEYCGQVIGAATNGLLWSPDPGDLKVIVIAGNEPFTQGTVDYHKTVPEAVKKGIIINTIFCGPHDEGVSTNWEDGAKLGEGQYGYIDQSVPVPHIAAPQDAQISKLGEELNKTYVPYGAGGGEGARKQEAQDANARAAGPAAPVQRAMAKGSYAYSNAQWDLVDAIKEKKVKLEDVAEKDLPEAMQKMKPAEREAYIKQLTDSRGDIQKQIKDLSAQRDEYVAQKRREQSTQPQTLGSALIEAIRAEAKAKGYEFDKK